MRLNDGLPVWHASVSAWPPQGSAPLNKPLHVEREAIALLRGVGSADREWWIWNQREASPYIGHLRVPVTEEEFARVPPGCALHDAGDSGPQRPRRR